MKVYLDNAATTKPRREVIEAMVENMEHHYGNPSSLHEMGLEVEKEIKRIRKVISRALGTYEQGLFFTSGGTESNNLAIRGIAEANRRRGNHLITTKIEHPSVLNTMEDLAQRGYEVTYLDVDRGGFISLESLEKAIRPETILVSIMHVNNEVGSIQPVEEIARRIKAINPKTLFHVDGIQSFGKLPINLNQSPIDSFALSGHKIHGPKGIGALAIAKGVRLIPVVTGGNQELGIRSGTENVPGIIGLGKAVEIQFGELQGRIQRLKALKQALVTALTQGIENMVLLSPLSDNYAPHIISVSFPGIKSEVLLHSLEEDGIFVSSGSACSSKKRGQSHVLKAMGLKEEIIDSTLRLSISDETTLEEIEYGVARIQYHVETLRKIMR